jgi:hypothetical protein
MLLIGESTIAFFAILNTGKQILILVVQAIIDASINSKIIGGF